MNPDKLAKIRSFAACDVALQFVDGHVLLGEADIAAHGTAGEGLVGRLKDFLKQYPALYSILISFFTSVRIAAQFKRELDAVLKQYDETAVIVNIGSGPSRINNRGDIINVDIFPFETVDVCVAPGPLPFHTNSVDLLLSIATLEHIADPVSMVNEFRRVLKPDGELLLYLPFMQPFHAAPSDFQRWTEEGCKVLCSGFAQVKQGIGAGPTSGFLWIGCEWLALLLSFGNETVRSLFSLFLVVLTSPLKYIDCLLEHNTNAKLIASAFYIRAKK
ncbi:MAG: methyltransferase domain-containing protein [Solidesulfovibrio sp. DCME]|uniref:methyltransferase domain-containing protein n=1 Tax=Solidesulfovibrio sp. DCME TaxID=3447380 RepID=UPI003D0D94E7